MIIKNREMDISSIFLFQDTGSLIMSAPLTLAFIVITGITSYQAFNNQDLYLKLIFNPYTIQKRKEWYRFWSYGLLHANWLHLGLNLFVLFGFGISVELAYKEVFGPLGSIYYLLLYGLGLAASSLFDYFKHKDNYNYNAVGASGAVSAVLFAAILFNPTQILLIYGIIPIPAVIGGALYLGYSYYMARKGNDNIGHDAHFWGAVWGFTFTAILDYRLLWLFWMQITTPGMWGW
jgi:membrane associated rhomboid family serine protease